MDLLVLTPVFHSPAHGAATYYRLLTGRLMDRGLSVGVISDREEGTFAGTYVGLFPRRCGLNWQRLRSPAAYAVQNLLYSRLPSIVRRLRPRCLLVHSSFYNHPGLFPAVARRLRSLADAQGIRLVADVREPWIPAPRVRRLEIYDAVVACSENVVRHLRDHGLPADRLVHIPVPQEEIAVDPQAAEQLLDSLGLSSQRYIFFAGLVKERKGADLLLRSFLRHVRPRFPDTCLAIAGLVKTTSKEILRDLEAPGIRYLGPRSRQEVLQLISRAAVCVSVSAVEGLSRTSLEALALHRPTLLPPEVPEYQRHCPEFVMESRSEAAVGARLEELLENPRVADYPIDEHSMDGLMPLYLEVLRLPAERPVSRS